MTQYGLLFFGFVLLVGCDRPKEKLFWVKENSGQRSDLLYLAESTNVPPIGKDSLRFYLREEEINAIGSDSLTFKNFGKLYQTEKFRVHVIFMSMQTNGRFYVFLIRTYDNDFGIIDDFELAAWTEQENQYCFGSIDRTLALERRCSYVDSADLMQIDSDGKIVRR